MQRPSIPVDQTHTSFIWGDPRLLFLHSSCVPPLPRRDSIHRKCINRYRNMTMFNQSDYPSDRPYLPRQRHDHAYPGLLCLYPCHRSPANTLSKSRNIAQARDYHELCIRTSSLPQPHCAKLQAHRGHIEFTFNRRA